MEMTRQAGWINGIGTGLAPVISSDSYSSNMET